MASTEGAGGDGGLDISSLTAHQQSALEQYTQVTAQDIKDAIPLLQRSQWNVQIAISKFFDGEAPDPVAEAISAQERRPAHVENLQESLEAGAWGMGDDQPRHHHHHHHHHTARGNRSTATSLGLEPAPRIVARQPVTRQSPWFLTVLLWPLQVGWRVAATGLHLVLYLLRLLPGPVGARFLALSQRLGQALLLTGTPGGRAGGAGGAVNGAALGGAGPAAGLFRGLLKPSLGRQQLLPRDAALRFRREFEEQYGGGGGNISSADGSANTGAPSSSSGNDDINNSYAAVTLPWYENGFAQALDEAKRELRFLLIVLLAPEHDDSDGYVRHTLLAPEVATFLRDPSNQMLLWGGNVADSEAWQVAGAYGATRYPFAALVCLTTRNNSDSTTSASSSSSSSSQQRMSIIKRLSGPHTPATLLAELAAAVNKYAPDLATVAATRAASEAVRNLRTEQDSAYERSLARDREKARRRREDEARRRAEEDAARARRESREARETARQEWRAWRAKAVRPEPDRATAKPQDVVRVAFKMPAAGERVVRTFAADASVEDMYAFVECYDLLRDPSGGEPGKKDPPKGYVHEYRFRIAQPMPRVVYEPDGGGKSLGECIGRSGNLIVEELAADEDEAEPGVQADGLAD